jgi:hypothetical protein
MCEFCLVGLAFVFFRGPLSPPAACGLKVLVG